MRYLPRSESPKGNPPQAAQVIALAHVHKGRINWTQLVIKQKRGGRGGRTDEGDKGNLCQWMGEFGLDMIKICCMHV